MNIIVRYIKPFPQKDRCVILWRYNIWGGKIKVKKYTFMQRKEDVVREWHHYDAEGQILGRLAVEVAKKLMGKTN